MLSDAHSKSIREFLSPTEHYAHARFCLDVCFQNIGSLTEQSSGWCLFCWAQTRPGWGPFLLVGRQSTESWSKGLSSFQTVWDRGSVSEWTLDSMWPSICIARIQMWPFESEKGTGGLVLSMFFFFFLPWGRTTLKPQQTYMITNVVLIDLQRRHFRGLSPQETISTLKTLQYILVLLRQTRNSYGKKHPLYPGLSEKLVG